MHTDRTGRASAGMASAWVERFLSGIRPGGRVLDVACGGGRHLRRALRAGFHVTGVDRDLGGVADLSGAEGVDLVEMDLESGTASPLRDRFGAGAFDGVIVTNYLWRQILPDIVALARADGMLVYETFALGNERVGQGKPSNPDFLLKPGELLEAIRLQLVAIAYEHVTLGDPDRVVQRIAAVGARHSWLEQPPNL
jgi:SAM-dependent methyltransferase